MPETKGAKKVLSKMQGKYGKKKGEKIYYSTANKQGRDFASFHKEEKDQLVSAKMPQIMLGFGFKPKDRR